MSEEQAVPNEGTYRALPKIEEDIVDALFTDGGLGEQLADSLEELGQAIKKVDEEMEGLGQANPGLSKLVRSGVEGLENVLKDILPSESSRTYLRVCTYYGIFLILRALDLQWRRQLPP